MIFIGNNQFARFLGTAKQGQKLHIYVQDLANAIYLAKFRGTLESNPLYVAGQQPGIKILNTNGPSEIAWEGEIWYMANSASVPFEASIEG